MPQAHTVIEALLPEDTGIPIVVGSIEDDGEIQMAVGKGEYFGHDDAFPGGWNLDFAWRFRPDTGTVYWWHDLPTVQTQDLISAHLRSKGYKPRRHIDIQTSDEDSGTKKWFRAHGVF